MRGSIRPSLSLSLFYDYLMNGQRQEQLPSEEKEKEKEKVTRIHGKQEGSL
jgi:hypothetical protein